MNSTTYAKRSEYKPIDMFFRGVVDAKSKTKKVVFIDVFQVLNDRYLGRMNVCNYFAVAENSVRINELNIIALDELKNYHLVMKENFLIPDNIVYSLPVSTRFLENDQDFEILLSALKDNGYKKGSIVLSFYGSTVERIDADAKKRYNRLRKAGYKTAVAQFGEDFNGIDVFANINFDYLRCEARYFEATLPKKRLLSMLLRYCNANKIGLIMEGVDTPGQFARFKREGIKYMTGRAASKLSRWVTNEFLGLPTPTGEKRDAYMAKLQKELDAKQRAELKELEELRKAAEDRLRADGNNVMPTAARPELAKSPYQVRLEQQRNAAKRSAQITLERQEAAAKMALDKNKIWGDSLRYEGDVQSALALSFAYEQKSELGVSKSANAPMQDAEGRDIVFSEDEGVTMPVRPDAPAEDPAKKSLIVPDFKLEQQLMNELRSSRGISDRLDLNVGMRGFGVTMHIQTDELNTPSLVGKYNDNGQWVDEDNNVYNGYFDENGKWIEYEAFDSNKEGHYNDNGQWVDKDGKVYDGYFDEEGRWIDYTYTDANAEIVDNGYFDDKLGKWVPFGYFDEQGVYHRF